MIEKEFASCLYKTIPTGQLEREKALHSIGQSFITTLLLLSINLKLYNQVSLTNGI